jgi:hypothetical protein
MGEAQRAAGATERLLELLAASRSSIQNPASRAAAGRAAPAARP